MSHLDILAWWSSGMIPASGCIRSPSAHKWILQEVPGSIPGQARLFCLFCFSFLSISVFAVVKDRLCMEFRHEVILAKYIGEGT